MTEVFAAVGVFVTVVVAVILIGLVAFVVITSIKEWLRARNEIVRTTKYLADTQQMLMTANNELNRRLTALESEVRDDKQPQGDQNLGKRPDSAPPVQPEDERHEMEADDLVRVRTQGESEGGQR